SGCSGRAAMRLGPAARSAWSRSRTARPCSKCATSSEAGLLNTGGCRRAPRASMILSPSTAALQPSSARRLQLRPSCTSTASAGGYTTLMALATTGAFAAGSSHYGVSDLALLLAHTHKFESGYLHRLMGTSPKSWKATFARRSPINQIDGITAPVILFQGLDD